MDRKEIKNSLRDMMPRGYQKQILEGLKLKGITELPQLSKISRVCNPDNSAWDDSIIEIALNIAKAERTKLDNFRAITA